MPETSLSILLATAVSIGFVHTLLGPDHYVPFIAMARAAGWSLRKTLMVTLLCGIGHVLGSVLLGVVGIGIGLAVGSLEWVEETRGGLAGWLLIGFGLAYMVWGIRRALRNHPHFHRHLPPGAPSGSSSTVVSGNSVAVSDCSASSIASGFPFSSGPVLPRSTPWVLFVIFVFGPCEPLIPILMYPAAQSSLWGVGLVVLAFGVTTIATMLVVVCAGSLGIRRLPFALAERFAHALAGFAVTACGAAIKLGL